MSLIDVMLVESGEPVDLELGEEKCPECGKVLCVEGSTEELAGLIGEDADGLPGFAIFHQECLSNRLLRAL